MRLYHNLASLNIFNNQNKNLKTQNTAIGRISSGVKFSNSKEDPNGLAQSERIRMQSRGAQMAQRNAQDGSSMLQAAEGGMDEMTSMLQRIRELSVQAGGASTTTDDKATIQNEIDQLKKGMDDISNNTEFNGVKLIGDSSVTDNSSPAYSIIAVGGNTGDTANIPRYNLTSTKLGDITTGKTVSAIDITTSGGVDDALNIADKALNTIVGIRTKYGALENRFDSTYTNLDALNTNLESADSSIRDSDIAKEMSNYANASILVDAGNALMAQTNRFPQEILKILDNVK